MKKKPMEDAHEEGADDRTDDADGAEQQRVNDPAELILEEQRAEEHRGDHRHGVGLEQVGRHAGVVADVVADVVGDDRGVARIVLWNPGLDLAHQVGADVSRLGVDATTKPGEDRH
jgi:hypothetical protein